MMMYRTFAAVALMLLPLPAFAASVYLDPDNATFGVSDTFLLSVRLDNGQDCINAAHIEIRYPTDKLKAVDFSRGGSIFSLWVEEPKIDPVHGLVTFSGGIPGGYCGRIPGDPALSNILGKIIFSVIADTDHSATVEVSPASSLYLNDGKGTKASMTSRAATLTLQDTQVSHTNPWIEEVRSDTLPPDPFEIQVESTRGIFGGDYYAVFATVDKQSGIDHYEILEHGGWAPVTSPHKLADQSLSGGVKIKAIDKAGNERLGVYQEGSAPPRQYDVSDFAPLYIVLLLLMLSWVAKRYLDRRQG